MLEGSNRLAQAAIENKDGVATLKGLEGVFSNLLGAALGLAGILLFITFIVGGFQYMTAGGDPKSLESARQTLTYAIAGIILVVLAYLILFFIGQFTGAVGILDFRIRI